MAGVVCLRAFHLNWYIFLLHHLGYIFLSKSILGFVNATKSILGFVNAKTKNPPQLASTMSQAVPLAELIRLNPIGAFQITGFGGFKHDTLEGM